MITNTLHGESTGKEVIVKTKSIKSVHYGLVLVDADFRQDTNW